MTKIGKSVIAATFVAIIAGSGAANAQAFSLSDMYIKGFGGATWPGSDDESLRTNGNKVGRVDLDYDTGYTLGLAAGWQATPNVGLEFEYAYRNVDYSGEVRLDGIDGKGKGDGTAKSNSMMVNAIYSFNAMGADALVTPYLGVGAGAVQLDYEGDKSTWGFGYQAIAGVSYQVAPAWSLYGEGRWFATTDQKIWPAKDLASDVSFGTFDLLVGAKYDF